MSIPFMNDELKKELYPVSEGKTERSPRLVEITRKRTNFFYSLEKQPQGEKIEFWEPFQGILDVQNEVRGIYIKPIICNYLFAKHMLSFVLEGNLFILNLLTLSWDLLPKSVETIIEEGSLSLRYMVIAAIVEATVVPIFIIRILATLLDLGISLFMEQPLCKEIYQKIITNNAGLIEVSRSTYQKGEEVTKDICEKGDEVIDMIRQKGNEVIECIKQAVDESSNKLSQELENNSTFKALL